MKKKLLVICGPTATGKTKLAIKLAKMFDGELISADSRQVYRGMDIGTGKDLPQNARLKIYDLRFKSNTIGYYRVAGVKIWGYDLVQPKEGFSAGQYAKIAQKVIANIQKRGKLPILVGGTGLYIKAVVDGFDTEGIESNIELRAGLSKKSIAELQEILRGQDPVKLASMNNSDLNNPLRLVRAIEVAQSQKPVKKTAKPDFDTLFIGLKMDKKDLSKVIRNRVKKRLQDGQQEEIQKLLSQNVSWGMQSMSSIGYGLWKDYFDGKSNLKSVKELWEREEMQYAGKQMTWFKRDKRIKWFKALSENLAKNVETAVKKWHN